MKILSLHIEGFGKFHDLDISFKDGLNVVYGKNEAGKSTLHTFIRGMLFGIEKQRGRAARNDVYSKYEPWKGSGTYEGWMRLESEGQIYRIQRRFQKQNKELTIVNETRGREVEPSRALLDQLRCGLSETAYDNTISIGQLKCATDGGMVAELRNYIANLNTSGSIALNITKATAYLKSQRRELENQMVPEAARSYTALLGDIRKTEQEISAPQYANQLIAYRNKKNEIRKQLDSCQKEKEGLLEKSAKGRQILLNSQFTDQESVQKYMEDTRKLYGEYQNTLAACSRKSRTVCAVFMFLITLAFAGASGLCLAAPDLVRSLVLLPFPLTAAAGISGAIALAACISEVQLAGNAFIENIQVFRNGKGGLNHVEVMNLGRIHFAQFLSQEVCLFLVVPFDVDFVAGAKDCFQQLYCIGRIYDFAMGIGSGSSDSCSGVVSSGMPVFIAWFDFQHNINPFL